jgi:hypothetical protein
VGYRAEPLVRRISGHIKKRRLETSGPCLPLLFDNSSFLFFVFQFSRDELIARLSPHVTMAWTLPDV